MSLFARWAAPKKVLGVALLSRVNVIPGAARMDARGYALFGDALTSGQGPSAPALITVRDGDGDLAFLSLTEPAFDLSDLGIEGAAPTGAINVFLATDRGAYRAGETVFETAIACDERASALSELPLTAVPSRPEADPHGSLDLMLRVKGLTDGEPAFAAIDVGIPNLTEFESPYPSAPYFGQRKLGVAIRDVNDRLIEGSNGALGAVRSGGDAEATGQLQAPPPTEELVASNSGPVEDGADGRARARSSLRSTARFG